MKPSPACVFAFALPLAATLPAQIEPGWGVLGSARNPVQQTQPGIWTFDPVQGNFQALAGLPPSCTPSGNGGVDSILVRDADGAIVAGTQAWAGGPMEIHVSSSNGSWTTYSLGVGPPTGGGGGAVSDLKWLPNGQVVFSYYVLGMPRYGLSSFGLAILDPALPPNNPAAVRPLPTSGLPNVPIALAVDPTGQQLYVGYNFGSGSGAIYRVPVTGGAATWQTNPPAGVFSLLFDQQGRLLVGTMGSGLLAYNTTTWNSVVCQSFPFVGAALDRTTGALVITWGDMATLTVSLGYGVCGTPPTPIPGFPGTQLATLGLDVRASLNEFDPPPTPHPYNWQIAPNPGGAARVGNTSFSLTLTAPPSPGIGFLVLGLGRTMPRALPLPPTQHVLLDPLLPISWQLLPTTSSPICVPLPVPSNLNPPLEVYAQVFALQSGSWHGSSGLWIHVI